MNKSNRTVTFLLFASLLMLLAVNLQKQFFPPKPNGDEEVAQLDVDQPEGDQNADQENADPNAAIDPNPSDDNADTDNADDESADAEGDDAQGDNEADDENEETDAAPDVVPSKDEFYQLGSLDPASGYRFLVKLNSQGATVRSVALNAVDARGQLKYRDLDHKGGSAGSLELTDTLDGCRIGFVGRGSPAEIAGLETGDIIVAIDGQPILMKETFDDLLEKTKSGQTVELSISRKTGSQVASLTLTDKPIQVLSKETEAFDPDYDFPESFVFTLRKKAPTGKIWPELDNKLTKANWEVHEASSVVNGIEQQSVEFRYTLDAETLAKFELAGPVTVIKRYTLEKLQPAEIENQNSRSWHLGMDIEIKNESDQSTEIGYQLDGPTGTPTEGWWYQIKIHGGGSLFKSAAGARDVVASSEGKPFVFIGGPEIVKNSQQTLPEIMWIFAPESGSENNVKYLGVDTLYFSSVIMPRQNSEGVSDPLDLYSAMAWHTADNSMIPKKVKDQKVVDVTPLLFKNIELAGGEIYKQQFDVFCGPKEPDLLEIYGLGETRSFGWFGFVSKPLCWLLHKLYWLTFQFSYAIPIIILTVLVRVMMIPFSRKAALNAQMMQHLSPKMKEIAEKYKDDMEKRSQAQRELFKKHKYNPFGGCVMMFFQLPIFLGLYRGLSVDIALRDQPLIPGVGWCSNLAAPDQLLNWESWTWMPQWLVGESGWLGPYLNILPLITMVLFLVQQKMFTPPPTDDQQKMMQKMMSFMMIFMGVLFFKVPSGLCLYFITSSIWGIVERKLLPKPVLDKTKFDDGEEGDEAGTFAGDGGGNGEAFNNDEKLAERKRLAKERRKKLRERGV